MANGSRRKWRHGKSGPACGQRPRRTLATTAGGRRPSGFLAISSYTRCRGVSLAQADGRELRLFCASRFRALAGKAGLMLRSSYSWVQRQTSGGHQQAAACPPKEATIAAGPCPARDGSSSPGHPPNQSVVADIEGIRSAERGTPECPAGQRTDSLDILQGYLDIPALAAGLLLRGAAGAKRLSLVHRLSSSAGSP